MASNSLPTAHPASSPTLTRAQLTIALRTLLADLRGVYEGLIGSSELQREGVRLADRERLARAVDDQQHLLERLAGLDQSRRELVARASGAFAGLAGIRAQSITLTDLARCADPDVAPLLMEQASGVRDLVARFSDLNRVVMTATRSLLDHAEGLVRHVARHLSHAGTYSRRGLVEPVPGVVSSLDLRS